jgi:hypothetical protein
LRIFDEPPVSFATSNLHIRVFYFHRMIAATVVQVAMSIDDKVKITGSEISPRYGKITCSGSGAQPESTKTPRSLPFRKYSCKVRLHTGWE